MPIANKVIKNSYYDSVFLMRIAQQINRETAVDEAAAMMGTEANKEILDRASILDGDGLAAGPNDLIVAVKAGEGGLLEEAFQRLEVLLSGQDEDESSEEFHPHTLDSALERLPNANLLLLSIPGQYVRREAGRALEAGMHVMIFSDNVPLEDELFLKEKALTRSRLVMGPDCGTALIGGKALGFGNVARKGPIGIVAASGTGIQEVSTLVHKLGSGITHAVGVGGKDLSLDIGALSFMMGLDCLENDPATRIIVLISKPPAPEVAGRVLARAREIAKPMVVCFLGSREKRENHDNLVYVSTLEDAARAAVTMAGGGRKSGVSEPAVHGPGPGDLPAEPLLSGQGCIRGLYSGGTLCEEALNVLEPLLDLPVYTNLKPRRNIQSMPDPWNSAGHTFVDLGEDLFTRGRPHPMIDFGLRCKRIVQEAEDPATAVILLDVVLGYGSHPDPAGALLPAIEEARETAAGRGAVITFVASICGTDEDPQNADEQRKILEQAGVLLAGCNAEAARLAVRILKTRKGSGAAAASSAGRGGSVFGNQPVCSAQPGDSPGAVPADMMSVFHDGPRMINMGLQSFHECMKDQERPSIHVNWRPPAGGDPELTAILDKLL